MSLPTRAAVVTEALSWQGTPFQSGARLKGAGVDCGNFLAAVYSATGFTLPSPLPQLPPNWFLHRDDGRFSQVIGEFAPEYKLSEHQPQPGDIILVKAGHDWAHAAIVIAWPSVIGAAAGFVVTLWRNLNTSPQYTARPIRFFDPWSKRP